MTSRRLSAQALKVVKPQTAASLRPGLLSTASSEVKCSRWDPPWTTLALAGPTSTTSSRHLLATRGASMNKFQNCTMPEAASSMTQLERWKPWSAKMQCLLSVRPLVRKEREKLRKEGLKLLQAEQLWSHRQLNDSTLVTNDLNHLSLQDENVLYLKSPMHAFT